jgi:hypothetical protein
MPPGIPMEGVEATIDVVVAWGMSEHGSGYVPAPASDRAWRSAQIAN